MKTNIQGQRLPNAPKTERSEGNERESKQGTHHDRGEIANRSLEKYLEEIQRFGLLSREEETELAVKYRLEGDEEASSRLILGNLRLVVKIAMSYQKRSQAKLLDLIQEGNLGLLQAVKKFDPQKGARFSYYAAFWIKAYIMRFMMANSKLVKIGTTQDQRRLFYNLNRERKKIRQQGLEPEPALLAERLHVDEGNIAEMECRLGKSEIPLDFLATGEANMNSVAEETDISSRLCEEQILRMVQSKLRSFRMGLSEKKAFIFDYRIMADDPLTLREIGEKYAISRERVRQIEKNIVGTLGEWLDVEAPEIRESYYPSTRTTASGVGPHSGQGPELGEVVERAS
jgi:RNA polymerase sigma-32 factor